MSLLPKNIKTKIGLSALSLTIAYLLADKLIEIGVINTGKSVLILLIFIFIFTIANFLFVADSKEKSSIAQTDNFGEENEQNIELTKTEKTIKQNMKHTKGSTQTIKIVPEK